MEQYRAWAGDAADALQRWYNPRTGLWQRAGWWNSANALTAVIQHSQRTGERRHRHVIETTFGRARRVQGEVRMARNYALEPAEVAAGYVCAPGRRQSA